MPTKMWQGYTKDWVRNQRSLSGFFKSVDWTSMKGELISFFGGVTLHGIFLNFSFSVILGFPFEWWTFPAFGFAWWYMKEEVPIVVGKIFAYKRGAVR